MSVERGHNRHLSRFGALGFAAVVLAAYLSAFFALLYSGRSFGLFEIILIVAASSAYLLVGIWGFAHCHRSRSLPAIAAYFCVEIPLAFGIVLMMRGGLIWLILLPLASQSVVLLPRRWTLIVCTLLLAFVVVTIGLSGDWTPAAVVGMIFLAALVFVVAVTQIAVNERTARSEVERLAEELREANVRLREYAVQADELATAKERNRLAREIHDGLGHYLTVINVQIEAARAVMDGDRKQGMDALRQAQSLTKEALADVRRSVVALRTGPVESRPVHEAIASLVDESCAAGIPVELSVRGAPRPLIPAAELTLYRAAQEGLTNVRKHARASNAHVTLDYIDNGVVRLAVQDDGVGGSANGVGFGLLGVRERTQLLGGQFRMRTDKGQGFTLEVELPG